MSKPKLNQRKAHSPMGFCRPALLLAAGLLWACGAGGQGSDLAAGAADMTVADQGTALTGPSCGQLTACILTCGASDITCDTKCTQGASATEATKAGSLALCAGLHCVGSDAGTGLTAILGCLITSCQSQLAACDGLPL